MLLALLRMLSILLIDTHTNDSSPKASSAAFYIRNMDPDSLIMEEEDSLDTHFRADMIQGRFRQRSLRCCGFNNTLEQQASVVCWCTAVVWAECPLTPAYPTLYTCFSQCTVCSVTYSQ
jgi:hypothetical protein